MPGGEFLTERPLKTQIMKGTMAGVWRLVKGVTIREIGVQRYLFQFFHIGDMKKVIDEGPWSFENNLLVLDRLQAGIKPVDMLLAASS